MPNLPLVATAKTMLPDSSSLAHYLHWTQKYHSMVGVELHRQLLKVPHGNKLLYKVMKTEDLMRSISGPYLHFNRVDKYNDKPAIRV